MRCCERISVFSEEIAERLSRLYLLQDRSEQTVFNDPAFLECCWKTWADLARPFGLIYADGREIHGAAFFRNETLRIAGQTMTCVVPLVFGAGEFTAFLARPDVRREFLREMLLELAREGQTCLLANLRESDWACLPSDGFRWLCYSETVDPVCCDREDRFRKIAAKKSLVRRINWFRRNGELAVRHRSGVIEPELIRSAAELHKERWAFDNVVSKFTSPVMVSLYSRLGSEYAEKAAAENAMVFTEVRFNDDPVAMHMGFRWADTFLYQVPVMNIEYIRRYPGEVLMKVLFEYAAEADLARFDLGRGDEWYKARYATERLVYRTYLLAGSRRRSVRVRFGRSVGRNRALRRVAESVMGRIVALKRALGRPKLRSSIRRGLARLIGFRKIRLFAAARSELPCDGEIVELDFPDYVRQCRTNRSFPYPLRRKYFNRFKEGWRLFGLRSGEELLSFAWTRNSRAVRVGELHRTLTTDTDTVWIMDAVTPAEFRRRGNFQSLMKHLSRKLEAQQVLIYASLRNKPSIRGIEKAGFVECGTVQTLLGATRIRRMMKGQVRFSVRRERKPDVEAR